MKSPLKAITKGFFRGLPDGAHVAARSGWRARLAAVREKMERSRRVFLLGLLVACAIEVLLDWNSTILEINTLRDRVRERATSYVALLETSVAAPVAALDAKATETASAGVFSDPDVVFLRATDAAGKVLFERVDPAFERAFAAAGKRPFQALYAHQLERDIQGMLSDPDGLRERMQKSRHRDFVQAYNDLVSGLVAIVVKPDPPRPASKEVLYQDRLYDEARAHDATLTWALASVAQTDGKASGVLLVAFSMERTNAAIRGKLLKGLGIVLLFVALLVVQNLLSRRDKIRLLEHESRQRAARAAVREALGKERRSGALRVSGHVDQTESGVDGLVWDARDVDGGLEIVLVDPLGEDAVTASVALGALAAYRARDAGGSIEDVLATLAEAARRVPLAPEIAALVLRVDAATGAIEGAGHALATLRVDGGEIAWGDALDARFEGLVGPLRRVRGALAEGATLFALSEGATPTPARVDVDRALELVRRASPGDAHAALPDAAAWIRGRFSATARHDLALVAVSRARATA